MRLHGDTITGTFSSRSPLARGQDIDFTDAKFKDNVITITITRPDIPFPIKIEGRIDKPDHMTGTVNAQGIQLDFEATRTEKAAPTLAAAPKGKKRGPRCRRSTRRSSRSAGSSGRRRARGARRYQE